MNGNSFLGAVHDEAAGSVGPGEKVACYGVTDLTINYLDTGGAARHPHARNLAEGLKMVTELEARGALAEALFEAQGDDQEGDDGTDPSAPAGAGIDAPAAARTGLGNDPGEIHSAPAGGRVPARLNAANYRIRAEDRLGQGSLKQKCRANFEAIDLLKKLEAEDRLATEDEKRVLVKYVGWGVSHPCLKKPISLCNVFRQARAIRQQNLRTW